MFRAVSVLLALAWRQTFSWRLLAAAIVALTLLGGCVDYHEEMWLEADLSGRAAIRISVQEELVQGNTGLERDMSEDKVRRELERIPGVKLESFKSFRDAGKRIAQLVITFDSIEKLTRHEQGIAGSSAVSLLGAIQLERSGSKMRLNRILPALPETRTDSWGGDLLMQGLGSLFLSNNYLTYKLHLPGEIITANTERIDGSARSIEWKFSVAQALRQPPSMIAEWRRASSWLWWAGGALLIVCVAAGGWRFLRPR